MTSYTDLAQSYDGLQSEVDYGALAESCAGLFREASVKVETVLDLACGTGTLTCALAEAGYETIGADASAEMLAVAAEKTAELPEGTVRPLLLNQSMDELDLYGTVDAAVCTLDSMNYVDGASLEETLRRLRLFIAPGGVLIFDVNTLGKFRSLDGETFASESEDSLCLWRCWFDEETGECGMDVDVFRREGDLWSRSCEEHTEYYHSEAFLRGTLEKHGFDVLKVLDGYPGALGEGDGTRLVFVCRR